MLAIILLLRIRIDKEMNILKNIKTAMSYEPSAARLDFWTTNNSKTTIAAEHRNRRRRTRQAIGTFNKDTLKRNIINQRTRTPFSIAY